MTTETEAAKLLRSMARGAEMGLVPGHNHDATALLAGAAALEQADQLQNKVERLKREHCRECRDEDRHVRADFILWGKLLPPEVLGPRCYDHAAKHIGHSGMQQIEQWAVYDLRPLAALDLGTHREVGDG
jgi:hypothetical protein